MFRLHRRFLGVLVLFIVVLAFLHFIPEAEDLSEEEYEERQLKEKPNLNIPSTSKATVADGVSTTQTETASKEEATFAHTFRPDGLLEVSEEPELHPILSLIWIAEDEWSTKVAGSSQSILEAAKEYERRYQRLPPPGFDLWWDYVRTNNVQLPDEYDQINRTMEPLWAIRPGQLSKLQAKLESTENSITLASIGGKVSLARTSKASAISEEKLANKQMQEQLELLKEIQEWLPDFRVTFPIEQGAEQSSASGQGDTGDQDKLKQQGAARSAAYLPPDWPSSCPPDSPAGRELSDSSRILSQKAAESWPPSGAKTFIFDHKAALDPCAHPELIRLSERTQKFAKNDKGLLPEPENPFFSFSTSILQSSVLGSVANDPWEDGHTHWMVKKDMLYWRGRPSEPGHSSEHSPAARLVTIANYEGDREVSVLESPQEDADKIASRIKMPSAWINGKSIDISFMSPRPQCTGASCDSKPTRTSSSESDFKYLINIDGNEETRSFKHLLSSQSLVLKSTIYADWYLDRIQPWYHYVPVKYDYSDLYDILTFFRGNLGKSAGGPGSHDGLAKAIAGEGRAWSQEFWRKEDVVAYLFRLYLEYARVCSPHRDSMNFVPKGLNS